MPRRAFWRRVSLLAVSVALVAGVTAFVAWDSWSPSTERGRLVIRPTSEPEGVAAGSEETPARPSVPQPIELGGFVYGHDGASLRGLAGVAVLCGTERAVTDAQGAFQFPPSRRPRTSDVRILQGDKELGLWPRVLTGARDGPSPPPGAGGDPGEAHGSTEDPLAESFGSERLPDLPRWIRWTFNVLDGTVPPGGRDWIRCDAILCEDWGSAARLRFRGRSGLPDGAQVAASLYFDGFRLLGAAEMPTVEGGRFQGSMLSPATFRVFSATYQLELGFSAMLQRMDRVEAWAERYPETRWFELDVQEEANVFLGSLAEARREDAAVEAYYRRAAAEVRRLERELRWRVEDVLDLAGGWDPAVLREMVDAGRYPRLAAEARAWDPQLLASRQDARDGWFYGDLVRGGRFDEARWRHFLDEEWRPALQALVDEHEQRVQEKYPEAGARLGAILRALLDESKALSSFVVYPPELPRHPNDFYPDEEGAGDIPRLERIIRDNSMGLHRFQDLSSGPGGGSRGPSFGVGQGDPQPR